MTVVLWELRCTCCSASAYDIVLLTIMELGPIRVIHAIYIFLKRNNDYRLLGIAQCNATGFILSLILLFFIVIVCRDNGTPFHIRNGIIKSDGGVLLFLSF